MIRDWIFRWGSVDDWELDVDSRVDNLDEQSRAHKGWILEESNQIQRGSGLMSRDDEGGRLGFSSDGRWEREKGLEKMWETEADVDDVINFDCWLMY